MLFQTRSIFSETITIPLKAQGLLNGLNVAEIYRILGCELSELVYTV